MKKVLLLIFLLLLFPLSSVLAYDYPIGIPDAWIEPDVVAPTAPSPWNSEQVGYYYIDYSVGSDSHTYGTPSAPRKTLPNPIPAGSYVQINGDYHNVTGGAIRLRGNGTADVWQAGVSGPVWVTGESASNRAEITGNIFVIGGNYIYLQNLYIHSGARMQVGSYVAGWGSNHILVRDSEFQGLVTDGNGALLSGVGLDSDPINNVIFYGNKLHSTGPLDSDTDVDARGIAVGQHTSNVWVLNNEWYDSSAGLQIEAGSGNQSTTHHIYIGKNLVYNVAQAGIGVKYALDVIISENIIHDIIDTQWSPSKGIGFQYAPDRTWIIHNKIYNTNIGIRGGSDNGNSIGESVYIIGNIIRDIIIDGTSNYGSTQGVGIAINNGHSPRYIINNTINNTEIGIQNNYYDAEIVMENNIIYNSIDHNIWFENGYATGTNSILNNNIFDNPAKIQWGDGVTRNLTDFQTTFSKGNNCLEANPLFVSSSNFQLQNTSPAKDSALSDSSLTVNVYDLFQSLYGIDIRKDFNGVSRPQGNGWDMGAFEYTPSNQYRADVDNNSQINSTDAMLTLRNSVNLDMSGTNWQSSSTTGDADCDGDTDSTDAMLILRYSLGLDMSGTGWCVGS